MYGYDQKKDYCYNLKNPKKIYISNPINLQEYNVHQTLILKLKVKSTFFSKLFSPYIEVYSDSKIEKTFIEHNASGIRYIDISSFSGFKNIKITTKYCKIISDELDIFNYENLNIKEKKVLIIAPHPDDAEISSFGLYSSAKESFIVTVTAGEGSCKFCDFDCDKELKAKIKGNLRIFDALTTGLLGKVKYENSLVLGYFNETIKIMYENKNKLVSSKTAGISDINYFRRVNHSNIVTNSKPKSNWDSLLNDFECIINSIKPDLIVTLHPQIDSNIDHKYITLAIIEAMEKLNCEEIKLLTLTNHLTQNEFYPYGNMFSTTALAPRFKTSFIFDSIYSHKLSREQQIYKYYALESMHDLRDSTIQIGFKKAFLFAFRQLRRYLSGKEKSYYRRSVRTNEIFYVTNYKDLKRAYEDIL
jgi:LmbE family N-acetylglucosaminyl deacetylase